ncbi:hypothetical protein N9L65_04580, partial [Candidatus Poseidoniales archaeon]|nr:hypothetical protein [Candidatus Poseidoniales archaeon]
AFSLTNNDVKSITRLSTLKGWQDILDWCDLDYSSSKRTDDNGKETDYIKIKNLHNGEEE